MVGEPRHQHPHPPDVENGILTIDLGRQCLSSALGRQGSLWDDENELELVIKTKPDHVDLPADGAGADQTSNHAGRRILWMAVDSSRHRQRIRRTGGRSGRHCQRSRGPKASGDGDL
jgi:hypothetical protein